MRRMLQGRMIIDRGRVDKHERERQIMKNIARKDSNHKVGHIMVVDDEAELMSALCEMLAGQGYETSGIPDGRRGLGWFSRSGNSICC